MTATNAYGDQVDPAGRIIVELRSDGEIASALGSGAALLVAGERPKDALAPFIVVRRVGPTQRAPRAPFTRYRIAVTSYGRTRREAAILAGLVSDALSAKGPRRSDAGVAIYLSTEDIGAQSGEDPDTAEPFETAIYNVHAPHTL